MEYLKEIILWDCGSQMVTLPMISCDFVTSELFRYVLVTVLVLLYIVVYYCYETMLYFYFCCIIFVLYCSFYRIMVQCRYYIVVIILSYEI